MTSKNTASADENARERATVVPESAPLTEARVLQLIEARLIRFRAEHGHLSAADAEQALADLHALK